MYKIAGFQEYYFNSMLISILMVKKDVENLDKLYSVLKWTYHPYREEDESEAQYRKYVENFDLLMRRGFFEHIVKRGRASILDVFAGYGHGGIALANVLMEKGVEVSLVFVDLREDAVRVSVEYAREKGISNVESVLYDALRIDELRKKFDLVIECGSSLTHVSSWDFIRFLSSVARCLSPMGLVVLEELDRMQSIFLGTGYEKSLRFERCREGYFMTSIHSGYDYKTGMVRRIYFDLGGKVRPTETWLRFWDISVLASFVWVFFEDVDIVETKSRSIYFVVGVKPRSELLKIDFRSKPRAVNF